MKDVKKKRSRLRDIGRNIKQGRRVEENASNLGNKFALSCAELMLRC